MFVMQAIKSTCPYCGVGCGVKIQKTVSGEVEIKGDPDHPANFGRLCSKGSALGETLSLEGRLLSPMIHGRPASWETALDLVAREFSDTVRKYGPDSVAFYVSGQLLTEDYYVINKLAKGFVGTANIDTNSRLCMASSVAGHRRAFGTDTVPGCYEDLEQADLLVLVGSNAAWCHPVLYQRMMAAKASRPHMRIVVIDPRRTDTMEGADLHLGLRSGSDAVLFNGLLAHLDANGFRDAEFVDQHTKGVEAALQAAGSATIAQIAAICGLDEQSVTQFFDWFAKTGKVVTLYSQGINQSASGTDKVNAILNCHLLTGRIGREGMGPFSLTGQPNAMGGREVGGLANQLAAHLDIDNPSHRDLVQRFWASPRMAPKAGLKAVDMFRAVETGQIKAIWIISTNPVVSLPDAARVREALKICPFVVSSDIQLHTDTNAFAHVLLPATGWGEKDGMVTNSERRMSRQRRFLATPGETRPDWRIICDVAKRMGYAGFDFATPAEIFQEHAALSGFENDNTRDFDISVYSHISEDDFEAFAPTQWPVDAKSVPRKRFFADGQFYTPDRKARFLPITPRQPENSTSAEFPMVLNTGRVRDQWHTMTRTGKSARLFSHIFEPYVELNPEDAGRYTIVAGSLVRLTTKQGSMLARAKISSGQRIGNAFVPMHWTAQFTSDGLANSLVNPATDPISGQPESKHTPVRMEAVTPAWQAFILSKIPVAPLRDCQFVSGQCGTVHRLELSSDQPMENWESIARDLLADHSGEWVSYSDKAASHFRFAIIAGDQLQACLYVAPTHVLPSREWLSSLFGQDLSDSARMSLMAGRPLEPGADIGPIICSCFGIGRNQIEAAIQCGSDNVAAIGAALKAGTNCGSCKPELAKLVAHSRLLAEPAV